MSFSLCIYPYKKYNPYTQKNNQLCQLQLDGLQRDGIEMFDINNEVYNFKKGEPFLVPFSNIPYIYNGSIGSLIRGASCFALFILEAQGYKLKSYNTVDYLFSDEECFKEMSITGSSTVEERLMMTQEFFEKHFNSFLNTSFADSTKLFVFAAFLDQLATDCFHYIEYKDPSLSNYINAYKNIELLAEHKALKIDEIRKYKRELLDLFSNIKPDVYCAILFNAA